MGRLERNKNGRHFYALTHVFQACTAELYGLSILEPSPVISLTSKPRVVVFSAAVSMRGTFVKSCADSG